MYRDLNQSRYPNSRSLRWGLQMTNSTCFFFQKIQFFLSGPPRQVGIQPTKRFSTNSHLWRLLGDNFRLQLQTSKACLTNQFSLKDTSEVNCGHLTKDSLPKTDPMAFGPSMVRTMAMIPILVALSAPQCPHNVRGTGSGRQ